jgi:hypothetical protein
MADIIGQANINKLSIDNAYHLLLAASDKQQMENILGEDKTKKISAMNEFNNLAQ